MELKLLVFVGVCIGCLVYADAIEGSGDVTIISDTDNNGDDDQDMSGEDPVTVASNKPSYSIDVDEGSGADSESDEQTNRRCDSTGLHCWCVYTDGSEVPGTRDYVAPVDCTRYLNKAAPTTPAPRVPTRAPVSKARVVNPVTQKIDEDDIIFVDETTTTAMANGIFNNNVDQSSDFDIAPKTDDKDFDNNIPSAVDKPTEEDEKEEENTNEIYGAGFLKGDVHAEAISHPGIMAALIGGGIVGLLCFILIILFIIYRVRKKDEGSYPLGDEKPLKNYAYSKAPSREFYA